MTQAIEHRIKTVRASAASESKRLLELVGEAEGDIATPGQQECAFFAYSICSTAVVSWTPCSPPCVKWRPCSPSRPRPSPPAGNELIRINVETALIERQMKSILRQSQRRSLHARWRGRHLGGASAHRRPLGQIRNNT